MDKFTAQRLEHLEKDIKRLHRVNRVFRRGVGVVALVGAGVLLAGAANTDEVVEAQKVILRDGNGKPRAEFGVDSRDNVALFLLDQRGNRSLSLGVTADGRPAMGLIRSGDKRQVTLAFNPIGDAGFTLYDGDLNPRARLFTNHGGTPTLQFRDKRNNVVFTAP